jgi:hypothetical protein
MSKEYREPSGRLSPLLASFCRSAFANHVLGATRSFCRNDNNRFWDRFSLVLVLLAIILVVLTFRDYGVTWDEPVQHWYGNFVIDYYVSFFVDKSTLQWLAPYFEIPFYGAAFDLVVASIDRVSHLIGCVAIYELRHLLNALVGVLGVAGCCKLGRAIGGGRAGFFAGVFLLLMPNYYGLMFNDPKDIPFAAGFVWAIYYVVRVVQTLPRPPRAVVVKLGVVTGITMGVRIGGTLALGYLGLLLALDGAWRAIAAHQLAVLAESAWTSLWRILIPAVLIAYPIMLVCSPWAQGDPVTNSLHAFTYFSHFPFPFRRDELFFGSLFPIENLPWTYLPAYIGLTLPELTLALLLCAPMIAGIALWRRRFSFARQDALAGCLLLVGIVFPVAYAIAIRAVLYDGMRHFIFVLPLVAVAAALVFDWMLARMRGVPGRQAVYTALALYGSVHLSIMAILHPDQYVYYNAFVGGLEGAQRKFILDYWGNSYADAVHGLERYLRAAYGISAKSHEFTVSVCGPSDSAAYYFPANLRLTDEREKADFFIAFTKDDCDRSLPGQSVYRVERMGALLSVVLDRREARGYKLE